jgi:hypothetical protein
VPDRHGDAEVDRLGHRVAAAAVVGRRDLEDTPVLADRAVDRLERVLVDRPFADQLIEWAAVGGEAGVIDDGGVDDRGQRGSAEGWKVGFP